MARASVASSFVACRRCLEGQVARASATCPDLRDHRMTVQSFSALQGPSVLPDHPLPSIMRQRPRGVPPRAPPLHNGTLCKAGPQAQHASAPRGPCPSAPRGSLCCNTARAHAMRANEQRTANSKQQTANSKQQLQLQQLLIRWVRVSRSARVHDNRVTRFTARARQKVHLK